MQSPRWTWLTLIACAAAAGNVGAQQAPASAPEESGPPREREWVIPPIRWNGSLAYDLRTTHAPQEGSTRTQLVTGSLGLRTFIYQPWLAVVSGNVGLTNSWTSQGGSPGGGAFDTTASLHEQLRSRQQFLTGSARVDVFPQSRFPFEAHIDRSDSRIGGGLASSTDYSTTRFGFTQRYRPVHGIWNVSGGYDHNEQSGAGFNAKQDSFNSDFITRWKYNDLNLGLAHSRARTVGTDDSSRYSTLVARHNYAPSSALSINTTANWTRTQEDARAAESDLQVMQWSSVGLWRGDGSPLSLSGSARALHLHEGVAGTGLDSANLALGATYEYSPRLRLTANGGLNASRSADATNTGLSGSVGASYQGDTLTLAGVRYDWFTSGSVGTAMTQGTRIESERTSTLNLQLGHSAGRGWAVGPRSSFTVNGSQALSWSQSRSDQHGSEQSGMGDQVRLLSTAAATWQTSDDNRTAYARVSYSDSMDLRGHDGRFKLFNFQLSGNYEIDNRRSLTGDLTFQRSWQDTGGLLGGTNSATGRTSSAGASGEITYRHQRLLGVPRLRFESRLKLAQDVLKQPGTLQPLPDRETKLWENRLDWSIGRIDAQAILRLSHVDGRRREALMFRIQRTFGD
jgi:hypothetical protein